MLCFFGKGGFKTDDSHGAMEKEGATGSLHLHLEPLLTNSLYSGHLHAVEPGTSLNELSILWTPPYSGTSLNELSAL